MQHRKRRNLAHLKNVFHLQYYCGKEESGYKIYFTGSQEGYYSEIQDRKDLMLAASRITSQKYENDKRRMLNELDR